MIYRNMSCTHMLSSRLHPLEELPFSRARAQIQMAAPGLIHNHGLHRILNSQYDRRVVYPETLTADQQMESWLHSVECVRA